jgi:hypothetical protein
VEVLVPSEHLIEKRIPSITALISLGRLAILKRFIVSLTVPISRLLVVLLSERLVNKLIKTLRGHFGCCREQDYKGSVQS